jgi:beta-glucosidase
LDIANTGKRAGAEVVQLYTHQQTSEVSQPIKKLQAFQRIETQAGEHRSIEFTIPARNLAFYDVKRHDFKVEPGIFNVMVGASSDDIRLRGTVAVRGSEGKAKAMSGKTGHQ